MNKMDTFMDSKQAFIEIKTKGRSSFSQEELFDFECLIANSKSVSSQYAREVMKGPFPLGELGISLHSVYALNYAREVLPGRFELGEKSIKKYNSTIFFYERDVLGKNPK